MRRIWMVCLTLLIGTAAGADLKTVDEVVAEARAGVDYVDNDYLKARLADNPDLRVVDVRTEAEYRDGYIPGAQWLDRGVVEFRLAEDERDPDAEIILYCRSGTRAALVLKRLQDIGYRNVRVHQGFESWRDAGEPVAAP